MCVCARDGESVSGMNEGVHEGRCGDERRCGRDENLRTKRESHLYAMMS
jgi:hypothetical protein